MTENEEALRAEVPRVCSIYCTQVWDKALNQARVEASFVLRKAKNIYYPPAIRAPSLSSSKIDAPPKVTDPEQHSLGKVPSPPGNPPEMDEQPKADEKGAELTKDVTLDNRALNCSPGALQR